MAANSVGQTDLRAENIDKIVKGFAELEYKFVQAVTVQSSAAWKETYFRETGTTLTAGATAVIKGLARGATPAYGEQTWTRTSSYIEKFMLEGEIFEEDILTDEFDVQ